MLAVGEAVDVEAKFNHVGQGAFNPDSRDKSQIDPAEAPQRRAQFLFVRTGQLLFLSGVGMTRDRFVLSLRRGELVQSLDDLLLVGAQLMFQKLILLLLSD